MVNSTDAYMLELFKEINWTRLDNLLKYFPKKLYRLYCHILNKIGGWADRQVCRQTTDI